MPLASFGRPERIVASLARGLAIVLLGAAAAPAVVSAQPVIHEIMQNPSAVADSAGEWFELFNPGGSPIDINGWTIEDNDFDSHVIANGGPLVIPAGGYLVLGNNGDSGTNGGVPVDYVYGSSFFLANGADEVVLIDTLLTEIDRVEWDGGPAFPDPNGASMALRDPALDNNVGANWCESTTPFGAGDRGTPGAANDCPAAAVSLVINEIDYDQPGTDTAEFVEIRNNGATAVDLSPFELRLVNGASGGAVIYDTIALPAVSLASGDYFVVCANAATVANCDLDDGPDTNFIQNGAPDAVALARTLDGTILDAVSYEGNTGAPYTEGSGTGLEDSPGSADHGISRCPDGNDTDQNNADLIFTGITPGAANDCPVVDPGAALSEIRIDQPGADLDEYFELTGDPGASLAGLTYLVIGDGADGGSGVIENVTSLTGQSVPGSGFFVAAESTFGLGTANLVTSLNFENSDNVTHLLVRNFSGSNGQDLDTDDDGTLDVVPWSALVDCVALIETVGSGDLTYCPTTVGPDGPFVPGHVYLCPEGWQIGPFDAVGGDDTPGGPNFCGRLVINEIDYDQPGTDTAEFVEIVNVGGTTAGLGGLALELVNGTGGGAAVYNTIALPSVALAPGDYFVVCGNAATVPNCDLDASPDTNLIENGAPDAVALVSGGSIIDTVSYEGDTGAPYTEGSGSGLEDSGSTGEDSKGISRFPDGVDTDQNNADLVNVCITPGSANTSLAAGCSPTAPVLEIYDIQGSGMASPFVGQTIRTESNAVTAVGLDGFFIQTPTARTDGDVDTSDGIFVFTDGPPGVAVGDSVHVTGVVNEFFNLTEFTFGSAVEVVGSATVPATTVFDSTVPSPDPTAPSCAIEFECYEGMLIEIVGGTVTGPNQRFGTDPIAEVHITAAPARAFREPGIQFPGIGGFPVWDGNPEVFELDPDKLGLPNQIIPAGSSFDAVGALGFEFGGYELWPTSLTVAPAPLPVPVRPRDPGEFTVGTLNLFRLFDDVDDPVDAAGRNDLVVSTAEYLRRRAKFADYIVHVLDAPDILAVQEAEKIEVLQALAADIAALDPSLLYTAYLVEGNDVGTIDNGFLVRDTVHVEAVTQLGKDEILTFDGSLLHDRPPLLLEGAFLCDCPDGESPIQVMAVHNRSLSGIDSPTDGPRVRQKRLEQAESIALKVQAIQDADPGARLVVAGDFNAFEFTDGYVHAVGHIQGDFDPGQELVCNTNPCPDLVDPNLANRVLDLPAAERYSFIFRGSAQVLDHALTSAGLDFLVRGTEFGRGNADAFVDLINDAATSLRSSDHDGLVLYLMSDCDDDGVADDLDVCACTAIPEGVPTERLGVNRFALVTDDTVFDTTSPKGMGPGLTFTTQDTAGCSCEQIIAAQGLGAGHAKFGCSIGAMREWVSLVSPRRLGIATSGGG